MTSRGAKYWNTGSIPLIAPDLLGDIIAAASDIALVISPEARILSVLTNPGHRYHGRLEHWEGANLRDHVTADSLPKIETQLERFARGEEPSGSLELNHSDRATWEFPIRYTFHRIGADGALLMLGRDLRPIAEMQQQLVKAQLALEKDYEAQREYDTRFRVLMDATQGAYVFVSVATGRLTDVNRAAAALLGRNRTDLIGAAFAQEFDGRRRGEFMETLSNIAVNEEAPALDVQLNGGKSRVMLTPTLFRAAGERLILCRLDPADERAGAGGDLGDMMTSFYQDGVDAIVIVDAAGVVESSNESFLDLADIAHAAAVRGKSFADFLARGSVDLRVLLDNASRSGQMRLYATKLTTEYGTVVPVEISVTHLKDRPQAAFVMVIRDTGRMEAARTSGPTLGDDKVRSVMEQVGSATLRDIVAETTDVVEKMCIETAVELTRNNRVAAAEMLGLSRQSLYVKLRKYDLLSRDAES